MADKKSVAKAYVQVVPTTQGIKGILSNAFGSEGSSAGSLFGGKLIGAVKGIVAAAGIGKMFTESILAGADMEQSLGGIETLFKDSADLVIANAENAYKTAGMSANAYMEAVTGFSASLLQGLGGDTQEAARIADMALTDMSDNANKMGTSMELIQNAYQGFAKQNYTMLDNLKLGYGGTKTEMQRLLKDAQKITGVKYDISNLADVYEAIHVIQEEMHISGLTAEEAAEMVAAGLMTEEEAFEAMGTTAKEAATTLSGSFASMKAAAGNLMAQLALGNDDLKPYLEALAGTVFTFAGNLIPMVGNILSGLPAMVGTALTEALQGLRIAARNADVILAEAVDLVVQLGTGIIQRAPYLAESAWKLAVSLGNALIHYDWAGTMRQTVAELQNYLDIAAMEILGVDGSIVDAVMAAISDGYPKMLRGGVDLVSNLAGGLLENLPAATEAAGQILLDVVQAVLAMAPDVWASGFDLIGNLATGLLENLPAVALSASEILTQLLGMLMDALPDLLATGVTFVGELAVGLVENIPAILVAAAEIIFELLATIASHLPDLLESGITLIGELAAGLLEGAVDLVLSIPGIITDIVDEFLEHDWGKTGGDIVSGIAAGITDGAGVIWDAARGVAADALAAAKEFLGIASPSKVMRDEIGQFIPAGIAAGIDENTAAVATSIHHLAKLTVESFDSPWAEPRRVSAASYGGTGQAATVQEAERREIHMEVHIHAAEGMDVDDLTERVMYRLQTELERGAAAFG